MRLREPFQENISTISVAATRKSAVFRTKRTTQRIISSIVNLGKDLLRTVELLIILPRRAFGAMEVLAISNRETM